MQPNPVELNKKAVKAALKEDWNQAIQLNEEILIIQPTNTEARTRLGRAYLQLGNFSKAAKCFKEVLAKDPINKIALKNYEAAKTKKIGTNNKRPGGIIKEPGTCTEILLEITNKRLKVETGDDLAIKTLKGKTVFYINEKELCSLTENDLTHKRLLYAKSNNVEITASVISLREGKIKILLTAKTPIFKADKQDVKPYVKIGSMDSDDLDLSERDENEEEASAEPEQEENTE